jgi:hypothetical protein
MLICPQGNLKKISGAVDHILTHVDWSYFNAYIISFSKKIFCKPQCYYSKVQALERISFCVIENI